MQKKLIAVAVTGALGAMAAPMAQAQTATVNVYGTLYAEYASISHGSRPSSNTGAAVTNAGSYQRTDQLQNPGSAIGFRGEEKLGGNMSAWFQCETTMDWRGANNTGISSQSQSICNRDSALGIKGAFGNIYGGNWGTPFKRVTNDQTGANDTGVFGVSRILYGPSSTYNISPPIGNINNTTLSTTSGAITNTVTQTSVGPGVWRRRQSNLLAYDTPNFNGFQGMAAVTVGNNATGATSAQLKPRLWSLGATYNNGPLAVGLAYERHKDFYAGASAACPAGLVTIAANVPTATASYNCVGGDERAWALTGSYTFSNNLKIGAHYTSQKSDVNPADGSTAKVNAYHLGMDWNISGPHGIRAAWSHVGDVKGSGPLGAVTSVDGIPTGQRIGTAAIGVVRPFANVAGNTSATQWQIRYVYSMSKRTELTAGYVKLNNSTAANYEMGGTSTSVLPGSDSHAYALTLQHKF